MWMCVAFVLKLVSVSRASFIFIFFYIKRHQNLRDSQCSKGIRLKQNLYTMLQVFIPQYSKTHTGNFYQSKQQNELKIKEENVISRHDNEDMCTENT